jgi:hypothetical protein
MASKTLTLPAAGARPAAAQIVERDDGTILTLDLGTTTGWALRSPDGHIASGTVSFRPSRYDGGGMRSGPGSIRSRPKPAASPRSILKRRAHAAPMPPTSTAASSPR